MFAFVFMFVYEYAFLFRMKERERWERDTVTDGKVGNRSDPSDDN